MITLGSGKHRKVRIITTFPSQIQNKNKKQNISSFPNHQLNTQTKGYMDDLMVEMRELKNREIKGSRV